jgi:hypothetical protein
MHALFIYFACKVIYAVWIRIPLDNVRLYHLMFRTFRPVFDPSLIYMGASLRHAGMIVVVYLALLSHALA